MANNNQQFSEFNTIIKLNDSKRDSLKISRKSLRDKIETHIHEKKGKHIKLEFNGQGSFETETIIEPIPITVREGGQEVTKLKYDIDDGVYFLPIDEPRERVQTYHDWIVEAVDGHTKTPPIDKNTCVRVIFADGHHIDIPIYYDTNNPELAHRSKGWIPSDPLEFKRWFDKKVEGRPQLVRIVRYLKAWADYRDHSNPGQPMPCGFILTILACDGRYVANQRDDIAFKETLILIREHLQRTFTCYRPTPPTDEDLLQGYAHQANFLRCLDNLITSATKALAEPNPKKACKHWQKEFGERFPCASAVDQDESNPTKEYIASVASTSRPWSNGCKK